MKKVDTHDAPIFALIEGDPGSGKTRLADTANACELTAPAIHLDLHGNTITLDAVKDWPHYIIEVESIQDLSKIYNQLAKTQSFEEYWPGIKFKSVIFDTLTEYHNLALDDITGNKMLTIGQRTKQAEIQHWGELLRETTFMIGKFQELPMHVFLTVQSTEEKDESTGGILHRPQLWGKSQKVVPAYVYLHGYLLQNMRLSETKRKRMKLPDDMIPSTRVLLFAPQFDSMAKDQYGKLGDFMVDPTIDKIASAIYG